MLCLPLYNCWVVLIITVADESDHHKDEESIWPEKVFISDLHKHVLPNLEFS